MFYRVGKNSTPSGVATTPSPLRVNTYWNEFKCLPSNLRAGVDLWTQYTLSHLKIRNLLIYNIFFNNEDDNNNNNNNNNNNSGAPRARSTSIYPRKFGYDVSVRSPVRTDAGEGGRESEVNPSGEEYVIAEVKFCISSTSFVSEVNHMTVRTFREKKKRVFLFTKF